MLNADFPPPRQSYFTSDVDSLKILVFEIAEHFFALPISVIFKVIDCPPFEFAKNTDNSLGIVNFEGQIVTVVNLAQKLSAQNFVSQPEQKRFLILTKTRQGELCGIPIDKPPALIELPKDKIQLLPSSARQINLFSIATHVATISNHELPNNISIQPRVEHLEAIFQHSYLSNAETSSSVSVQIYLMGMPENY